MVDLVNDYLLNKKEFDKSVNEVLLKGDYINGSQVAKFSEYFCNLLDIKYVVPCANGTDALQIALMSLNLKQGDEVIVPAFTYAATAEVIGLLKLKPVIVDVCPKTFNISYNEILNGITYADIDEKIMQEYSILINTTPVGMYPKVEEVLPIPYHLITDKHFVFDLVYNPEKSKLLSIAENQGAQIKNGLDMLHIQAEEAWKIFGNM